MIGGLDPVLVKSLFDLGCTVVVVAMMLIFAYKLFSKFGKEFIKTQKDMATAMGSQASSMGGMKESVELFIRSDAMDHREILLSLQVVGKELVTVVESLGALNERQENIETLVTEIANERKGPDHQKKSSKSAHFALSCG